MGSDVLHADGDAAPTGFQSTLPVWGATGCSSSLPHRPEISIHAPRVGSDEQSGGRIASAIVFQSTLPVWGATVAAGPLVVHRTISIHAPRVGSDCPPRWCTWPAPPNFNPRSPCGERLPFALRVFSTASSFQSTLPVWGATGRGWRGRCDTRISIHAPRVGSDLRRRRSRRGRRDFNPRSPCGERLLALLLTIDGVEFQSTLPVWGATVTGDPGTQAAVEFQSTLPVWGATPTWCSIWVSPRISIHAPRVGSDCSPGGRQTRWPNFNPRSPCGERQFLLLEAVTIPQFQSTLPVWGATVAAGQAAHGNDDFNPRSPCGERLDESVKALQVVQFQSTLPVWGATSSMVSRSPISRFQSTLPVWGATIMTLEWKWQSANFNPRSPCGERPNSIQAGQDYIPDFNPRSPCGERRGSKRDGQRGRDFNPRSPCGERRCHTPSPPRQSSISIHAPRVGSDLAGPEWG